jgi:hypothetical protein
MQRISHGKKKDPNLPDFEEKKFQIARFLMISSSR